MDTIKEKLAQAGETVASSVEEVKSHMPLPPQRQDQPGHESKMLPKPEVIRESYRGAAKLLGKVALITGGDSGIGRAVAVHFAREGADVAIMYLNEHDDAKDTVAMVEKEGRKCLALPGNIQDSKFCTESVEKVVSHFGRLDILVNNAAEQHVRESIDLITDEQLEGTFRTNIFAMFYMARAAVKHLPKGGAIINTTSITAYQGHQQLLDYSATKGAIVAFTRSLSQQLVSKGIRVNAVAPGPIWTPLIPATFSAAQTTGQFSYMVPMMRAGQPSEVAPSFVFLACEDAAYMAGQVLHPNGGVVLNG